MRPVGIVHQVRVVRHRSKRAKIHLACTTISAIACLVLAYYVALRLITAPDYDICHTKQCVTAAHHILSFVNESVDPCDNFYEFMCGNYINNPSYAAKGVSPNRQFNFEKVKHQMLTEHLDEDEERKLSNSFRMKRMFYKSCLNVSEIEEDDDRLYRDDVYFIMGGWPLRELQETGVLSWKFATRDARQRGMKSDIFFTVDVHHNQENNSFSLQISPPSEEYMTGPVFSNIFNRTNIDTILGMAKHWDSKRPKIVFKHFRTEETVRTTPRDLAEAIDFAHNLAEIVVKSNAHLRSEMTIREKDRDIQMPKIVPINKIIEHVGDHLRRTTWLDFLKEFTKIDSLQPTDTVVLNFASNYSYFDELYYLIGRTSNHALFNYVALNLIYDDCLYLSNTMRHLCLKTMSRSPITRMPDDRNAICSAAVDNLDALEHSIDVEFARRMHNPKVTKHAREIFDDVKELFLRSLRENHEWGYPYFDQAYSYFVNIKSEIGWTEMVFDATEYDKYYVTKPDVIKDTAVAMRHQIVRANLDKKFQSVKSERHLWNRTLDVPTVDFNAFFDKFDKRIFIQSPLLLEPVYGINRTQSLNYGTLGHIIGHEFIHALDTASMIYPTGVAPWDVNPKRWEDQLGVLMNKQEKCLIDAYKDKQGQISGLLKLKPEDYFAEVGFETYADFGGMKLAYAAYESYLQRHPDEEQILPGLKYTPRQLFWIMSGIYMCGNDTYERSVTRYQEGRYSSDHKFQGKNFRINVARMYNAAFQEDFQCEPGDNMYRSACDGLI